MVVREPEAILEELGSAVESAVRRRRRRPRWRRLLAARRGLVLAVTAVLVLVPTAVATHSALFAREPPSLPSTLRAPGAQDPTRAGAAVYVAAGDGWRLSASTCRYGAAEVVGVFLTVPGGGAGARCDGARPATLAARRIHTYFDPQTGATWVFGTLPASARTVTVEVAEHGTTSQVAVAARESDAEAIERGGLPAGLRVVVARFAGTPEVVRVAAADERGTTVLQCDGGRCSP